MCGAGSLGDFFWVLVWLAESRVMRIIGVWDGSERENADGCIVGVFLVG